VLVWGSVHQPGKDVSPTGCGRCIGKPAAGVMDFSDFSWRGGVAFTFTLFPHITTPKNRFFIFFSMLNLTKWTKLSPLLRFK
ncbi:hypothetical protein PV939_11350, partial [Ligilactobacillus salivarius]|nr:hypothetical protein [Ligilactobacillus salivarius]